MQRNLPFVAAFVLAVLVAVAMSMFTVDQRRYAIVFQLGEIKEVITEPGLNFKWPLIQNVRTFDKRILTYDAAEPERFITSEKKPVLVDAGLPVARGTARHGSRTDLFLGNGDVFEL